MRFLFFFVALGLFAGPAAADNLSPRAFADAVATAAATALPTARVMVTGNLQLQINYGDGSGSATLSLSNAYDLYLHHPEHLVANLIRLLPKIEMRAGADKTWLISAGGDYESSLLLLSDLWSSGQIKVDGEIVVAVPAKDALLVTGSRNAAGVARLRKFAAEVASGAYGLTKVLFIYRDGKFATFELNNR
jgi:hypothetical protein